ncbi:hypothetical protein IV417_13835 [Alphaproteobacteria bacterium KMM 3653]|uniref:Uncharacterized protein n=1 Tax=Harenicola maris TaxID=2841044 RepID=A0AAP2G8N1_9RHOB|nr:hypothetical protein [Harenicola maris]
MLALAAAAMIFATGFFVSGFVADAIYFNDPANQNRPLERWMSPRYVGQSWQLPRPVIVEIMEIDPEAEPATRPKGGPRTVGHVLERTGMTMEELEARVREAQQELRARRGK